jgi:hypothetical protein
MPMANDNILVSRVSYFFTAIFLQRNICAMTNSFVVFYQKINCFLGGTLQYFFMSIGLAGLMSSEPGTRFLT